MVGCRWEVDYYEMITELKEPCISRATKYLEGIIHGGYSLGSEVLYLQHQSYTAANESIRVKVIISI